MIAFIAIFAYAKSTGPDEGYTGAPGDHGDCTSCHDTFQFANVGPGSVTVSQTPAIYQPGASYTLNVVIQDPQARRWGFQLTALDGAGHRAGTFTPLGSDTQIATTGSPVMDREYIEHTQLGTFPGSSSGHTWQVQWTAPSTDAGTVRFFVAGNAANNDGTNQGDYIYTSSVTSESPTSNITLTLLSDPSGQTLPAGSSYTINWSVANTSNIDSYELRYSTDDGVSFPITNLIFSTTNPDTTTTAWTVPNVTTPTARIRLLAATKSGSAFTVISGRFSIEAGSSGPPAINSVTESGNRVVVTGENFQRGAIVQVNGQNQATKNLSDFSHNLLCKKAGKHIAPGSTVMLTVTNPDGSTSEGYPYQRLN